MLRRIVPLRLIFRSPPARKSNRHGPDDFVYARAASVAEHCRERTPFTVRIREFGFRNLRQTVVSQPAKSQLRFGRRGAPHRSTLRVEYRVAPAHDTHSALAHKNLPVALPSGPGSFARRDVIAPSHGPHRGQM